ncbi:heterokaryon incompatibility 6 OR allele [Fusarium subglutinans]|uniref:Heterokaryon incompatibility 6 OR allele n=1 Tax=Gibberella subglutinans TaxID=42677 RepID=A0A8H5V415_GIBSU|nr:heterokaryon incompatibility 6 OR allele [Fusarium subglutinans]KAF5610187.1 heterokaryon incompatibility 6 OR allele [Fusarium subglutinans]
MQELSLAPRLTLMSRDAELSWDVLKNLFKDEPYLNAFHMGIFVSIKLIEYQRRLMSQGKGKGSKLMDVLVDYKTSVPELYQQATVALINLAGHLDILCQERPEGPTALRCVDRKEEQRHKLLSWVAEYDGKRRQCVPMLFAPRDMFNAGIKNCETPCRLIDPKKDILVTKGTFLGTVVPVLQEDKSLGAFDAMNLYPGREALERPQGHLYAPKLGGKETTTTGETAIRAFWRTMIERLDVETQEELKDGRSSLQTYRLHFGNRYSRSAFSYQPADDEDLAKLDIEGQISHHYSSSGFMFAVTDNGLFLATRFAAKEGDIVAVLDGGKVPLALRKVESRDGVKGDLYMVVGSTYVHGFMDGEAEVGVTESWLEKREILIA